MAQTDGGQARSEDADVALAEASSHGLPICEYDLRSRGAWAYMNLAKEILQHDTEKAG